MSEWHNWSGQTSCAPAMLARPRSEDELAFALRRSAGRTVRPIGSSHSFTQLCVTEDVQIDVSEMRQLISIDAQDRVRVQAGISLHELNRTLLRHGLALPNLGDIDVQTLAGAAATGTHGTGLKFGNISQTILAMRVMTADGTIHEFDDGDELRAARISLGALGVVTEFTLQCVPAFRLHRSQSVHDLDTVLAELPTLLADTDHLELYLFPHTRRVLLLQSTRTDEEPWPRHPVKHWVERDLVENGALGALMWAAGRLPAAAPWISKLVAALASSNESRDESAAVFASPRKVKFTEMEYSLPLTNAREAIETALTTIERDRHQVAFPLEVRFTQPDDALLAPAYGRESVYLAAHQTVHGPWESYFGGLEPILIGLGGRPHWGKRHTLTAEQLSERYPEWGTFQDLRARLDPGGTFSGGYLNRLLGPISP
ncbi:D-arabinono-1,4-lactone oxidase [Mycobacteroides abscessus]|nr:D-arabinono-1,4-lactone oxidase [Mycobacteroides abscessus]AFN62247.1 oxidoreductase [Mycobacteroides abscessus subsp. massiliense str. GO 06]MDB2205603.1 FAD-binding protein [Mycobacteroides abscessus subsp. massiliense]MDB2210733.1 FAD-binding protein [Mycobacteroides abscessus subsp. massiliense]MDB2229898.1 FAD-binding protein [Mycobacteroides abscessus subsp. abscessus]MDB2234130.1 FAD-binding protein [Mycobacteroides abscessus subsp. massiliense]